MSGIIGNDVNIRIARLLGVLRVTHLDGKTYYDGENYEGSLDSMHEALKILNPVQMEAWKVHLRRVTGNGYGVDGWAMLNATADQRAAAFLKTME